MQFKYKCSLKFKGLRHMKNLKINALKKQWTWKIICEIIAGDTLTQG